jgi:hypothetical protein
VRNELVISRAISSIDFIGKGIYVAPDNVEDYMRNE